MTKIFCYNNKTTIGDVLNKYPDVKLDVSKEMLLLDYLRKQGFPSLASMLELRKKQSKTNKKEE